MPIVGNPRRFHHKHRFIVEIDGIAHAGFQKCSELSAEAAEITYYEGGSITPYKSAGKLSFPNITLERGAAFADSDLYLWFLQVADAAANAGLADPLYKRTFDIVQLDRDGTEMRRYTVYGAFPVKFTAGSWDNEADEVVIEMVELAMESWEVVQ